MMRFLGLVPVAFVLSACSVQATDTGASQSQTQPLIAPGPNAERRCGEVTFNVTGSETDPTPYHVFGVLCSPGSLEHRTIQLLLHGATYTHTYWDFPYQEPTYSYVDAATKAGYATLAIDRLGYGRSDHPANPDNVTLHTDAFNAHQIVQQLRSGSLVVDGFGQIQANRVMLVGHSLGAIISTIEADEYADVDGVIVTGYLHTLSPNVGAIEANLFPAIFDPKFQSSGLAFDYFTTVPGTRGFDFYDVATADPNVIALDEATKDTVTLGEMNDIFASFGATFGIHAPVLNLIGDEDNLFCVPPSCTANNELVTEQQYYSPQSCVQMLAIPNTGHDLNLHYSAPNTFATSIQWSDSRVGSDDRYAPPNPCNN